LHNYFKFEDTKLNYSFTVMAVLPALAYQNLRVLTLLLFCAWILES